MPLISTTKHEKKKENKVSLHSEISESVNNELQEYLSWADIKDLDQFFEETCKYIFENDRDWKKLKKDNFDTTGNNLTEKEETETDITNQMVCDDEGMTNLNNKEENPGVKLQKKK
ncbi:hypothetical protein [Francisella adeliensis]|uniref:Uncharacterized protein n=1 Tax=Francisella adeliensis TaxID=2007306 RepID=A0A2Z4XX25_9GAMM|nr:hypothetical protein [Francisella adeliensis]AXA32983.1 hypothetical protein CDH04_00490 [Francisella adeliensis]MBK2086132.1 hypothetical protein [Francisella adeliensis]MBK2096704.1 hypothetical protein [Francisella adeliensis]QIW11209.1 hypothetical protein FZC43_00490 [Francisella adeliensis]QIW13085.1 hypothetical protein FZC44_00490 [Francisella adeliensis]